MNPAPAPRRSLFNFSGGGKGARIALFAGIGLVIIILLATLPKMFSGGGLDKTAFLSVLQDQSELAHLAQTGVQSSTSATLKNFSATVAASMPSEQSTLLTYLADNHYKPNDKSLALKESADTDTQLQNAVTSSTFDSVYTGIMQQQFRTYQQDLNAAYQKAGTKGKDTLKKQYANAQLLLTQITDD